MVMLALYPFGVPLMGMALLWKHRGEIQLFLANLEQDNNTMAKPEAEGQIDLFKSLFIHYRPSFFWWGLADIIHRLLLTGS